ncbi:DUF294 nucleotidyltransferase-like domain-containing protein [Aliiglaciecola sp. CAU 1673]|uniref:DUF294 nucleotidyltransferase-like domain-containing protein n=1 Tax=Aliiglaciecola sp. CAU 1673 TaxID=3032595 RepID=UPI0023DA8C56|nr:DUF294 nucleotidyltransferase-like domain-containing protein [Aliiglaciecola sp. CAU 1673]MDF2180012.1 DUF294 nucleotidyltransferase-like domain-containing protein [Aliiglaciecola sp. CAU 1673]
MIESTRAFLNACAPFDQLSDELKSYAEAQMILSYLCQDNVLEVVPREVPRLYLVKQGVFDLISTENRLIERLEPGDLFGYPSLMTGRPITNRVEVVQDGLLYAMPQAAFDALCNAHKGFADYFTKALQKRLLTETKPSEQSDWTELSIADVLHREPVRVSADSSLQQAARLMQAESVSCLLVTEGDSLCGILTDKDIRNRVVAEGQSYDLPVRQFMTSPVHSLDSHALLFEAMQTMSLHNVHHLAVTQQGLPKGVITVTDLISQQRSEPLYLINAIRKAGSVTELEQVARQVPDHLSQFANRVVDVKRVGDILASFTDAFNHQLIRLYIRQHGVAPYPFVWLTFGSQARKDQSLSSDQDNGMLLDDAVGEKAMGWYRGLAEFVCDGLARCGLKLCGGNIMATNPKLCLPLGQWLNKFRRWIEEPDKKALLHSNIFFDRRALYGDQALFEHFDSQIAAMAGNQIFLANLAANSANLAVPIGLFNRFVTVKSKYEDEVLDIKTSGIAIINDIVRIHALANKLRVCATPQRLQALGEKKVLQASECRDLKAAWQFLVQLRLQHQLKEKRDDNLISPDTLDSLTRRQLKTAFRVIKEAQEGLAMRYARGGF